MIGKPGSAVLLLFVVGLPPCDAEQSAPELPDAAALQHAVRADWAAQERRLGRTPQSAEAINAALLRTRLLLESLRRVEGVRALFTETAELQRLAERTTSLPSLDAVDRQDLYERIRTLARGLVLANPLVTSRPILFMMRRRPVG